MTATFYRCLAVWLLGLTWSRAAVFHVMAPVETRKGERRAYLWVPPESERVKGMVIGGMTLMERELVRDPRIRQACAANDLALVFLTCGLKALELQPVLDRLAEQSGYPELAGAPLFFVGHSAGGPQARFRAREMSDRCFGLVQYRGGDPGGEEPLPPGIPALMICGQFDEFGKIGRDENGVDNWEKDRDKMVAYRSAHPSNLGNFLVEPGAGHFAWSDRCAEFLALFIAKAAAARIPDAVPSAGLKTIEPETGWLTDPRIKPVGKHAPAAWKDYTGDRTEAMWHVDRELAMATVAFVEGLERKDQFLRWKEPHWVSAGARNFLSKVRWVGDGRTFRVHPMYAETYPVPFRGRGSRWARGGEVVGHSDAPIRIKPVSGPLVHDGEHRLRMEYNELAPATEIRRVTFMAYSDGNGEYRYTERVGMYDGKLLRVETGRPQALTFPPIEDGPASRTTIELNATSDAGMDVDYHIAYGPARIEGRR
ncbi:MAG: hypothetical protein AAF492_08220, partial [Verrucomicrobiota bacterium]